MVFKTKKGKYSGIIDIPASKSDSQRAVLIASLVNGISKISNIGVSKDELSMLDCVQNLGATIQKIDRQTIEIKGVKNIKFPNLFCGESGLGLRLLTAITSLSNSTVEINGTGTLLNRNQLFFEKYYPKMGVSITSNNGKLPIIVKGPLQAGNYIIDGSESSQYISGLLIAFSQIEGNTNLIIKNCTSKPYINMTIQTLKQFGVEILETKQGYQIKGRQKITPTNYLIEGDWSSASYWLVASALGLNIKVRGLSMSSKQADKSILNAFIASNCKVNYTENNLSIDGTNRKPLNFDANNCPDLFPALVTYASLTPGTSIIKGVNRLQNKESNRGLVLQKEFKKLGVIINIIEDEMIITGNNSIKTTMVNSHHDHRIAMCLAIASIVTNQELLIENAESVSKSYPNFWEDLKKLKK